MPDFVSFISLLQHGLDGVVETSFNHHKYEIERTHDGAWDWRRTDLNIDPDSGEELAWMSDGYGDWERVARSDEHLRILIGRHVAHMREQRLVLLHVIDAQERMKPLIDVLSEQQFYTMAELNEEGIGNYRVQDVGSLLDSDDEDRIAKAIENLLLMTRDYVAGSPSERLRSEGKTFIDLHEPLKRIEEELSEAGFLDLD